MYRPDERQDVEVRRDGAWHQRELLDWQQREDGWWANVRLDEVSRPARTVAAPVELG